MISLYQDKVHNPKYNAQNNLSGRTHYVDDDTLRFHKSRILKTFVTDGGLLFALIESCSANFEGTKRVFRPVIFDVFGNTVDRPNLDDCYTSRKQAEKALWEQLNAIDAHQLTIEAIERQEKLYQREIEDMRKTVSELKDNGYIL